MKFRVTASSIIISLLLCVCCLVLVFTLGFAKAGYERLDHMVEDFLTLGDKGITISAASMDGTLAKALTLNNLKVTDKDKMLVQVEQVKLSIGLFDIIKLGMDWGYPYLSITVSDAKIYVNEDLVACLKSFAGNSDQTSSLNLPSINFNLQLSNASAQVDYLGFESNISGLNASAVIDIVDNKIKFQGADLNLPALAVKLPADLVAKAKDIRLSVDESLQVIASLDEASLDDYGKATEVSALLKADNGKLSLATYFETIDVQYADYEAKISKTTANIGYDLSSKDVEFTANLNNLKAKACENLDAQLYEVSFSGRYSNGEIGDLEANVKSANVLYDTYGAVFSGLSANVDLTLSSLKTLGYVAFDNLSVTGLQDYTLQALRAQNAELDFSYNLTQNNELSARVKGFVSGSSSNVYLGKFSTNVDATATLKALLQPETAVQLSNFNVNLSGLTCATLTDSSSVNLSYIVNKEVNFSVVAGSQLNGSISLSLEKDSIDTRLYFTAFKPYSFTAAYNQLLSQQATISENTSFDGSIVFALRLPENTLELDTLDNINLKSIKDLSKYVDGGLFSVNLAVRDLTLDAKAYSGAVSFESTLNGSLIDVGTLAVSTNGFRLSYSGTVDYNELIPDGTLSLQKSEDGSEVAALNFDFIEGTKSYSFKLTSPILKESSIYGTLDWQDEQKITASAFLQSNYLKAETIPFDVTVIKNPIQIEVKSEFFSFAGGLEDQSLVKVNGLLNGLEVKVSDWLAVAVDVDVWASYDLVSGKFDFDVGNFDARISDFFRFSFASSVTSEKLTLEKLTVTRGDHTFVFDGALKFEYPSIAALASIAGEGVSALVDLKDQEGIFSIFGTVLDGQYYLDVKINAQDYFAFSLDLNLLGTYKTGFYATGSTSWGEKSGFDFNAQYSNGVFAFYDSAGSLGSLSLKDIAFNLDSVNMAMLFSFTFENEVQKKFAEAAHQRGKITLSAQLESFANSLISLVTGLDFDANFTLALSDFYLEDGYSIPDNEVKVFYSKGFFTLTGDLINGTYDSTKKYIDLQVDKSFLFGLKMKGYLGSELDLYLSDLYIPLPLLNQFTNFVLFGFNEADITGSLLIKGDSKDPSFYGMLYCQSYEMWLSYLPSQTLSVKNIAISVQDHSFIIAKTPVSGHSELDGRFLDAAVSVTLDINNLALESYEIVTDVYSPVDLWVPLVLQASTELEIRGDATGLVIYGVKNGKPYLKCDTTASNMLIDFDIEDKQPWIYDLAGAIDLDIDLTIGDDVEFCYPQKDSAFIDFTLSEGEKVNLTYDTVTKTISTAGSLDFKTGQVYYFQNDFYITEGSLDLSPKKDGTTQTGGFSFTLNLNAKLNDYDSNGDKIEINLILQNATLDNISPRFTSTPSMTETEILSLLGQTILPSSSFGQSVTVASVASLAAAATDAISRLGIIESNSNYSLTATIRDSLGFDIFSLRSNILQNIIIDALPGEESNSNLSLLSKYLDGTSLFAGKYLANGVFAQMSLRLKSEKNSKNTSNYGHFLSKDLILDMEFSVDWDNPVGTFTIFTKPQELSALNILDTIGFSVTKRMQF